MALVHEFPISAVVALLKEGGGSLGAIYLSDHMTSSAKLNVSQAITSSYNN